MEVQKHPHHVTHKKKWAEYVLEFLMLFLAVFLGFIAENIREHYAEKENAKRYLTSYRDELLQQKGIFTQYIKLYQKKIVLADSLKNIFFNKMENDQINVVERLLVPSISLIEVPFNTSSYDQMVSSGALRYINSIALRDTMGAYKSQMEITKAYNTRILQTLANITFDISKILDFHDIITTDTSRPYDVVPYTPQMRQFPAMSPSERNSVVFFFEAYVIQAQTDLRRLRNLEKYNDALVSMVNRHLGN